MILKLCDPSFDQDWQFRRNIGTLLRKNSAHPSDVISNTLKLNRLRSRHALYKSFLFLPKSVFLW